MQPDNLAYALTQLVHNFGAVAVVGGAAYALGTGAPPSTERRLARLVGGGWALQIASGAGFGVISYYYYGLLPDIHGIAVAALYVKIACAAAGLALALRFQQRAALWSEARRRQAWRALLVFGAVALAAAAFLRWFS